MSDLLRGYVIGGAAIGAAAVLAIAAMLVREWLRGPIRPRG